MKHGYLVYVELYLLHVQIMRANPDFTVAG